MPENPNPPPKSDSYLRALEVITVSIVVFSIWLTIGFAVLWIAFGIGDGQRGKLAQVLQGVNLNWKICLLLLIPLFYRTCRDILERIVTGPLGTKFPKAKQTTDTVEAEEEEVPSPKGTK